MLCCVTDLFLFFKDTQFCCGSDQALWPYDLLSPQGHTESQSDSEKNVDYIIL